MSIVKTDELEMKVAFLEDALEKLSEEFFTQQKQLGLLQSQHEKLIQQVRTLNEGSNQEHSIMDEKPPHY